MPYKVDKQVKETLKKAREALKKGDTKLNISTFFSLKGMIAERGIQLTNIEAELYKNKILKAFIKDPGSFDQQNILHTELLTLLASYFERRFEYMDLNRAANRLKHHDQEVEKELLALEQVMINTRIGFLENC